MSIKTRLIILLLAIAVIPLFLVGALSFFNAKETLYRQQLEKLEVIADLKVVEIERFFEGRRNDILAAQEYANIKTNLPIIIQFADDRTNPAYVAAKKILDGQLKVFHKVYSYEDVMLVNPEGKIVYVTNETHVTKDIGNFLPDPGGKGFTEGKKGVYFTDIYGNKERGADFEMLITAPAYDSEGKFIGIIAFQVDMDYIYKFVQDATGLGKTGETLIGKKISNEAVFLNSLRHDSEAALTKKVIIGSKEAIPIQQAVQGQEGSGTSIDYRDKEIIAVWRYIPALDWGLVAKVDTKEAFASVIALRDSLIIIVSIVLGLVAIMAFICAKSISQPIIKLTEIAELIARGDLSQRVDIQSKDEIGNLANSFNKMAEDLQKYQNELLSAKNYTDSIISSMIDTLIVVNPDATIRSVNKATLDLLGYKEEELIEKDVSLMFAEEGEGLFKGTKLENLIEEGSVRDYNLTYKTKSGEKIPVSFSGSVMYEKEIALSASSASPRNDGRRRIVGIVGIARDMRQVRALIADLEESKKGLEEFSRSLEKRVAQRTKDLSQSQTAMINIMEDIREEQLKADELRKLAEKASNAKSQFLANMSHEIRTPMNAIIGFVALLKGTAPNKQQEEYLDIVSSSAQALLNIINDLLDISRIEAGEMKIKHTYFNLKQLVRNMDRFIRPEIEGRPINLHFNIEKDVPLNLKGDSTHLRQIFINLLSNAVKFTEKGEVSLDVRIEKILDNEMRLLRFTVRDAGIGIPEDKKKLIFDAFTQIDQTATRKYGGTGLGLSICKAYVKSMGGDIWVESELGKGSQFIFTAQFKEEPQGAEKKIYPLSRGIDPPIPFKGGVLSKEAEKLSCEGIRVLTVEDNPANQKLMNVLLKKWGCIIDLASHGKEAIEKIKENKYDLVLMDLLMPVMDGFQAAKAIRKDIGKDLPVIALTAAIMERDKQQALPAGIDDYLTKPIEPEKLKEAILKWGRQAGAKRKP